jgi:predicted nuclease of predicted toxin-antitoxin system
MKFFFDNNLSENLTRGLKDFGEDVVHLKDLFNEKTEDQVWLEEIGQKKMFLITRDERIRRNPFELNALKTYNVGAFFLV